MASRTFTRVLWSCTLAMGVCAGWLVGWVPPQRVDTATLRPADVIIILGNRPPRDEDGQVAAETRRRVEAGVRLYEKGLAPRIVVTGGPTSMGVEADVMATLAHQLGVPAEAILSEPLATDTITNARQSIALLCKSRAECTPQVIVVSNPYHLDRAQRLFECAGAEVSVANSEMPDGLSYRLKWSSYEAVVRLVYLFIDECAQARASGR